MFSQKILQANNVLQIRNVWALNKQPKNVIDMRRHTKASMAVAIEKKQPYSSIADNTNCILSSSGLSRRILRLVGRYEQEAIENDLELQIQIRISIKFIPNHWPRTAFFELK